MGKDTEPQSREERLAARLRENLRRRKAQARAIDSADKAETRANPSQTGAQ